MVQIVPSPGAPPLSSLTPRFRCRRRQQFHESHRVPSSLIVLDDSDSSVTLAGDDEDEEGQQKDFTMKYDEDDYMDDEQFEQILSNLTADITPCANYITSLEVKEVIPEFVSEGKTYKPGKSAELRDGTFLRIREVVKGMGGEISLQGWRLQRQDSMNGLMPERINELCWIVNLSDQEAAAGVTTHVDEVGLHEVKGLRIIRFTNRPYPMLDPQDDGGFATEEERRKEGILFCRSKYVRIWATASTSSTARGKQCMEAQAILFLSPQEADSGYAIDSDTLRFGWRGKTIPGGSYVGQETSPTVIDLSENSTAIVHHGTSRKIQQYTFGDGFCGAGGVSRGALQAGLRLNWGFDHSVYAMDSFRLNFETAIGYTCDVADFLANSLAEIIIDILHFSPPCQTFSPAKTIAAATDDDNEACIFCVRELLMRTKPRVVTMEETAGLQQRHEEFLFATIHAFAELGYSCRWKLLKCQDYGVPQLRQRLVILASGPGEPLPPFPKPTHSSPSNTIANANSQPNNSHLPRFRTIHDAISTIPPHSPDHDIRHAGRRHLVKPAYDPHTQAKTITCNGGENYHPSGTRSFTNREFACMQTFPLEHRFCGKNVRRQIGNAVPPVLGKAIFLEVRRALEAADGVVNGSGSGSGSGSGVRDVVEVL
ncbi:hypothetical protein AJ78_02640 [Emergomyces pasteurianus Ep9510]|uniref:DNA (cytosine-5-)-methyltransferase n=1 Tax=Emergomyces pasteurianus Ep9510 TaxID=1447872 RepID=A0A1J9PN13_9EURO|nr:hypothetical protein AJ78_02640 [Emergomyces pasteurianus Ep9510]